MRLTISTLFFFVACSCIIGCAKHLDTPAEYYCEPLSDSLRCYLFNPGSYWVYQNDSTNMEDSTSVIEISHQCVPVGGRWSTSYKQTYNIIFHDYLNDFRYDYQIENNVIDFYIDTPIFGHHGGTIFIKPVQVQWGNAINTGSIDSITIGNKVFTNVTKMKLIANTVDGHLYDYDSYLYFKDSVGIIKKEIGLAGGRFETWSLKRWNIIL